MPFVEVAFPLALSPLVYEVDSLLEPGTRVYAPLKGKIRLGFVVREVEPPEFECEKARPIEDRPIIPSGLVELIRRVAAYYLEPVGLLFFVAFPPHLRTGKEPPQEARVKYAVLKEVEFESLSKRQKELVELLKTQGELALSEIEKVWGISRSVVLALERKGVVEIVEKPKVSAYSFREVEEDIRLTKEQAEAIENIKGSLGRFKRFLLFGVTGSGKTEVYKRLAQEVVNRGGNVLILVPEIALTPHYIKRFHQVFGETLAVLHSGLSDAERARQWLSIAEGRCRVVVGTRSAVFAPFDRCHLIIVDEEHDASYKQQESPRYNARDVAIMRAQMEGCPVVLGSATPSVESYTNAVRGKYTLVRLTKRVSGGTLPEVEIVDMAHERGIFSKKAVEEIEAALSRNEGIMVLINRRGYSRVLVCRGCRRPAKCPNCDVSLTPHATEAGFIYVCHWCGYEAERPPVCSRCKTSDFLLVGYAVQRVQEEISRLFPEAVVERMDRETASGRFARWEIIERMERGEIDILVGTQMIAKGHHFPRVTLAVILCADAGLNIPDFRASERTYQLICQMAGRAGRTGSGKVIVQSYNPEHHAIRLGATCSYEDFYEEEVRQRREFGFPPFSHLVRVIFVGSSEEKVREAAGKVAGQLKDKVEVLGPSPCGVRKLKNKYRWQLILRGTKRRPLLEAASEVPMSLGSVRIFKDVDPYEFA